MKREIREHSGNDGEEPECRMVYHNAKSMSTLQIFTVIDKFREKSALLGTMDGILALAASDTLKNAIALHR